MSARSASLVAWALGTFHASVFVLVIVSAMYAGGGLGFLLQGLDTVLGLLLFVVLWATTLYTTRRALAGSAALFAPQDRRGFARRALRWGGVNGVLFLAALVFVFVLRPALTMPGASPLGTIFLGVAALAPIAFIVAFVAGAALGQVFAGIDLALVWLAKRIHPSTEDPAQR